MGGQKDIWYHLHLTDIYVTEETEVLKTYTAPTNFTFHSLVKNTLSQQYEHINKFTDGKRNFKLQICMAKLRNITHLILTKRQGWT
jgi:hypothetical protein